MDNIEAQRLLHDQLAAWRSKSHPELASLVGESHDFEVTGPTGVWYQGHIRVVWDDQPHGNVRVIASIDDGGWRAFMPLTDDFIMRPDGTLIGE